MARKLAQIEQKVCVACGVCAKTCPRNAISVFHGLFAQVEAATCIGCGKCANSCPADIITLISREVAS